MIENQEKLIESIIKEIYKRVDLESDIKKESVYIIGNFDNSIIDSYKNWYRLSQISSVILPDIVLVTQVSIGLLSHIALICPINSDEELIIKCLLSGKKVFFMSSAFEYENYRQNAHKNIVNVFNEYKKKVTQLGVKIIDNIGDMITKENKKNVCIEEKSKLSFNDRLLQEKDLINNKIIDDMVITVNRGCIITPLAQDYMRLHRITIQRE